MQKILIGSDYRYDSCPAYAAQYVAISSDVHILGPTTIPITTYEISGMKNSVPLPEWRIKSTTPWHELWRGLNGIMIGACEGLMSNETAMQQLKVLHIFKPHVEPSTLSVMCTMGQHKL